MLKFASILYSSYMLYHWCFPAPHHANAWPNFDCSWCSSTISFFLFCVVGYICRWDVWGYPVLSFLKPSHRVFVIKITQLHQSNSNNKEMRGDLVVYSLVYMFETHASGPQHFFHTFSQIQETAVFFLSIFFGTL